MIEKITDQNLERYDSRLKEWCDRKFFEKGNYGKYQTTEKAGAVAFYPVPNTLLEGKIKFSFKETMPASGDKGPDNPSTIAGVESIKVVKCGKNLLKFLNYPSNTVNGVTCSADSNGIITLDGTASADVSFQQYFNPTMRLDSDTTVFCSYEIVSGSYTPPTGSQVAFYVRDIATKTGSISLWLNAPNININGVQRNIPNGYEFTGSNVFILNGTSFNNLKLKTQIEFGNVKTSWESPNFSNYNFSLGNTYYGGEIDLATGVMTVTHSGLSLDGDTYLSSGIFEELTDVYSVGFYPNPERLMTLSDSSDAACSILPLAIGTGAKNYPCAYLANNAMRIQLQFSKVSLGLGDGADADTVRTAVKTFFAQHPGFIVWPIATPYTVQLSLVSIFTLSQTNKYTPRFNTVYTDADSVQISYLKSPIRDEYEKTQAILSLGGNS